MQPWLTWETTCSICPCWLARAYRRAPADAAPEVLARVNWVSTAPGGRGAVREFIEMVLRAQNRWDGIVREYASAD